MVPNIGIIKRNEDNFLENYVKAVNVSKANSVLIDNTLNEEEIFNLVNKTDGILFTGGSTWNLVDELILKSCLDEKKPFLGICLGMQMIGNYFSDNHKPGEDKTVIINSNINHNVNDNYAHKVLLKDGMLSKLFNNSEILVNSYHNYSVDETLNEIIKGYSVDEVIEALEISDHPFGIGVQWHPEKMIDYDLNSKQLFKKFISEADKYKNNKLK